MTDTSGSGRLSTAAIFKTALVSLVVWFCVAVFIRYGGAAGVFTGWPGLATYAATVAVTPLLNRRVRKIADVPPRAMAAIGTVALIIPPLLEGIVMQWWPALYGGDPAVIREGAIWLLWAIGVGAAFSVWTTVQAEKKELLF